MANSIFKTVRSAVKNWWLPLIMGLIFILTSIWTFMSPNESYLALAIVFSISFLVSGFLEIVFSISNREVLQGWGWTLAFGILTVVVGVLLLSNMELTTASLPLYVGFLLMFQSFMGIGYAFDLKSYGVLDWGNLLALGILGVLFSFILIWNPIFGGMTLVIWTGIAFMVVGIYNIYIAFRMRKIHRNWNKVSDDLKNKIADIQKQFNREINE